MSGRLDAIWIKSARRGAMRPQETATLVENRGLLNSADQNGRRQVTIITREMWDDLMQETGGAVDPSARRANLLVSGIELQDSRGRRLRIGGTIVEIRGETRPCERMDEALPGLRAAMGRPWGGGAFGTIEQGGDIAVGDTVEWLA